MASEKLAKILLDFCPSRLTLHQLPVICPLLKTTEVCCKPVVEIITLH